jgi:type IV pilus assembly protein PilA
MRTKRRASAFTLIELLVVIIILAILMAVAVALYLRAVRDSQRQTCRANMQAIAQACQAYKVRSAAHQYPGDPPAEGGALDLPLLAGEGADHDFGALPRCPGDDTPATPDYTGIQNADGSITISCASSDTNAATFHNAPGRGGAGYTPGIDAQ